MKNKVIFLVVTFGLAVLTLPIVRSCSTSNSYKDELRAIEHKRDSLYQQLNIILEEQRRLVKDTAYLYEELRTLRKNNEYQKNQLYRMVQREIIYEKELNNVLNWSDSVMDSLFRNRYPSSDNSQ